MTTAPLRAVKAQSIHHFRSFDVVMAAFVAILLLSNVIGAAKVASLGGWEFGAGILFFPLGYVIGDVILFYLDENEFNLVGRAPALEWVEFHAASGQWNVTVERDERWAMRSDGRRNNYRFQVQGPNAMKILSQAMGTAAPDLKFFNMAHIDIAGPAFLDRPVTYYGKGGTGVGVRLLTHFLAEQSKA